MKKLLLLVVIGLTTWIILAWDNVTAHPNWYHAMIIVGGIIALALVAVLLRFIIKFVKWMVNSPTYLILSLVSVGLLTVYSVIPVGYGILTCVGLSILFTLAVVRHFAMNNNGIFLWLTGYKLKTTTEVVRQSKPVVKDNITTDRQELIEALKSLGFNKSEREEGADYAIQENPNATVADKLATALVYFESNKLLKSA